MHRTAHLLLLAGTIEAREMAHYLSMRSSGSPELRVTASLAGVTTNPEPLAIPTRTGGFGGVAGLADWVRSEQVTMIIDMTHPYAAQMSKHAVDAAIQTSVSHIRFERECWLPEPGDRWQSFKNWQDMIEAVPAGAHVFVAGGSNMLSDCLWRDDITVTARALLRPDDISDRITIVLSFPKDTVEEERAMLQSHNITHIFCKNSGGMAARAKIDAARMLGLEVWMLERPNLTEVASVSSLENLQKSVEKHLSRD